MKSIFKKTKTFEVACKMPKLKHINGKQFDFVDSETAAWIMAQPEIQNYICRKLAAVGAIYFNPITKTWIGINSINTQKMDEKLNLENL